MRILVSGGAGFIGSHVVDGFVTAGHEVAVVDNLSTGSRSNLNPRARFYEVDIRDRDGIARVFAEFCPEVVNHHAAQAEVPRSIANPMFDADVNLVGGLNLLRQSVAHGVRKFVFSSSGGAIYGNPSVIPCDEEHPVRPLSPYGVSKACFEQYLAMFNRTFGLDYTVLRYANVYGERQGLHADEGRVAAIFARRMLRGAPVTIDGDGEQARDLVYVSDVVSANLAVLQRGSGQIHNIGTGVMITVNEIFRCLQELIGYRDAPRYGPRRQGDVYRIAVNPTKAMRERGWIPLVPFSQGGRRLVRYLEQHEPVTSPMRPPIPVVAAAARPDVTINAVAG